MGINRSSITVASGETDVGASHSCTGDSEVYWRLIVIEATSVASSASNTRIATKVRVRTKLKLNRIIRTQYPLMDTLFRV